MDIILVARVAFSLGPAELMVLLGLLVVWAILLFGGFAVGPTNAERTRRIPLWGRLGSSAALVLAAWLLWLLSPAELRSVSLWLAVGMTLGFIGDVFMAHVLPVKQPVIGGMASFGLGHVAYSTALLILGATAEFAGGGGVRWAAWLAWLAFGAAGWYLVVWRGSSRGTLQKAALPYALLLASTTGLATGLAILQPGLWALGVGAALFLLSDLVLATQLFNGARWPFISDAVWLTYGPGQMLIVYALFIATL
ncbi:MAG TPA: lysoplasmalogenase [Herpetosiphonaceae bacterium]|nr:lysoplasmalogenase [Herpetosiphonaceae bacterium]